jgi:dTDP-4-dehydrorhamnose reductase
MLFHFLLFLCTVPSTNLWSTSVLIIISRRGSNTKSNVIVVTLKGRVVKWSIAKIIIGIDTLKLHIKEPRTFAEFNTFYRRPKNSVRVW